MFGQTKHTRPVIVMETFVTGIGRVHTVHANKPSNGKRK